MREGGKLDCDLFYLSRNLVIGGQFSVLNLCRKVPLTLLI